MSVEANKVIVRRTFEEIFNQGNLALVETWVAATFVNHAAPAEMLSGPESLKGHVVLLRTAFPDLYFTVEELIADEECVAARVTFGGTHRGVFRGFPPTNKSFVQSQMHLVRFSAAGDRILLSARYGGQTSNCGIGGACAEQAYPVGRMISRFAPFAIATLTGVLLDIAPSAR